MAGITWLEEFQEDSLRGLVDASVEHQKLTTIDQVMPNEEIFNLTFAYDIIKKNAHIAPYVGYGAEPPVIDRDAVASQTGQLAKMALKYIATEEELLALNMARNNKEKEALIEKLTKKSVDLLDAIQLQIYSSKMQAVNYGRFQQASNGVQIDYDFMIPDDNKHTLTGAQKWDNADADIIGDLIEWTEKYVQDNGKAPDVMFMSRKVFGLLAVNKLIVQEARGDAAKRATAREVEEVLASYDLPKVEVVTSRQVVAKGEYTKDDKTIDVFPENRVVMASYDIGKYLLGPTQENNGMPGIVLQAYDKFEPIQSIIRVAASGFPVIEVPQAIVHADVIDA